MQARSLIFGLPIAASLLVAVAPAFQESKLDHAQLKAMVTGLGYEAKDLNATKVEFTIKTDAFNIPIGAEVSPSGRYIWLTSFLGEAKPGSELDNRSAKFMRANGQIQPTQFYITSKESLMCAIAVENRNVQAASLKFAVDKLVKDLSTNSALWLVEN